MHQRAMRHDITGLRALAIVQVVAFHAGVPGFTGGFVGVDVFFVISGFLITGQLLRELETTGRLHLGRFWAKRLRRLVPAAALMIVLTLPLALLFLPPVNWLSIGKQAGAALLFVSNFFFARQPDDYFTHDLMVPQPYLHTWSLSVEEQFYLVWPVLLVAVVSVAVRAGCRPRVALAAVFGVVGAGSFALSAFATPSHPQSAFYLLPTRAWEFALAGLLALVPVGLIGSSLVRGLCGGVGVFGLVAIVVGLPSDAPYPGVAAMLPVAATLLVIVGGLGPPSRSTALPTRVLEARPLRFLGTVSYSWYLWHWPLIVLLPVALRSESPWIPVAAGLLALVVGASAYAFFENPVRFAPPLARSARVSFVAAGAFVLVAGVFSGATWFQGRSAAEAAEQLAATSSDELPSDACLSTEKSASGVPLCILGDVTSSTVVVVVGDSHAGHFEAALGEAARREKIRLVYRWRSACPAIDVTTVMTTGKAPAGCQAFRDETERVVADLHPTAVVISQAEAYLGRIRSTEGAVLSESAQKKVWVDAYEKWIDQTSRSTGDIAAIRDNPRLHYDPGACLAAPGGTARSCASPRGEALDQIAPLQALSARVQAQRGVAPIFTTTDRLCDYDECKVEVDGVKVYRDYNHLAPQYTATLGPALGLFLREAVDRSEARAASGG